MTITDFVNLGINSKTELLNNISKINHINYTVFNKLLEEYDEELNEDDIQRILSHSVTDYYFCYWD